MAMTWRPAGRSRERILAYGPAGAGKTYGAMTMLAKALGPDDTAYIIDVDNSWDRMLEGDGEQLGLFVREEWRGDERDEEYEREDGKLVLYHCRGWEQSVAALAEALNRAGRDDWIVVDSMSWLWDDILEWYVRKVHGSELPDFLMQHRLDQVKAGKITAADKATAGQDKLVIEWNFINPIWMKEIATPITNAHCHIYLCSEAKEMRTDGKVDKQLSQMFSQIGWVPKTQKKTPNIVQTVLYLTRGKLGEYTVTSVKDRSREDLVEVEWGDLGGEYLRKVAGWKPKKVERGEQT